MFQFDPLRKRFKRAQTKACCTGAPHRCRARAHLFLRFFRRRIRMERDGIGCGICFLYR